MLNTTFDWKEVDSLIQLLRMKDSLYIDDIGELTTVSNDPSRRSQIFFNLFNGIKVNPNLIDKGERISGVLDSLCTALHVTLEKDLSQAIVATVAIQSLKRLKDAQSSTLHHLNTIFKGVYNDQGKAIPQKMELLSHNIKHIFIMIDEVTGDESGVEFLHGLHTFLKDRELLQSPLINTKVIVADASIVDPQIINQHLEDTAYEPDKIYFRRVAPDTSQAYPLHKEPFFFLREPATVINTNAYPASKLHVTYKIGVDALQFDATTCRRGTASGKRARRAGKTEQRNSK